jgi:hypothetical protein
LWLNPFTLSIIRNGRSPKKGHSGGTTEAAEAAGYSFHVKKYAGEQNTKHGQTDPLRRPFLLRGTVLEQQDGYDGIPAIIMMAGCMVL